MADQTIPENNTLSDTVDESITALNLSNQSINDLGTLFTAIREASDKHSAAYELAGIGQHLSDSWGSMVDDKLKSFENLRGSHASIKN